MLRGQIWLLIKQIGTLSDETMVEVSKALGIVLNVAT
jgi:mRNA-degrading endonuclease toxin of MazEF toxin-antitoxin module